MKHFPNSQKEIMRICFSTALAFHFWAEDDLQRQIEVGFNAQLSSWATARGT